MEAMKRTHPSGYVKPRHGHAVDAHEWILLGKFFVPCVPVPQPRQRSRVITVAGRAMTSNYTPARDPVNAYKAAVQLACREAFNGPLIEGPTRVDVTFVFDRPKYLLVSKAPRDRIWCDNAKDVDNLQKSTFDALNGILWVDDRQVVSVRAEKQYRAIVETAGVEMFVYGLAEKEAATDGKTGRNQ